MARSSSGPGRRPLKAEITGSTPVRATTREIIVSLFCLNLISMVIFNFIKEERIVSYGTI